MMMEMRGRERERRDAIFGGMAWELRGGRSCFRLWHLLLPSVSPSAPSFLPTVY